MGININDVIRGMLLGSVNTNGKERRIINSGNR